MSRDTNRGKIVVKKVSLEGEIASSSEKKGSDAKMVLAVP